jgi:deazaflavin-dependent oxidoreductase (nitroreductase family)
VARQTRSRRARNGRGEAPLRPCVAALSRQPAGEGRIVVGLRAPTHALLETIGRKTGKPWRNPVGNGLAEDKTTFWIVAEHGRHAGYVRNIAADPHVRVKIGRRWRSGVAEILGDDDPRARLKAIGRPVNGALVRTMGTDLLTIRIALDDGREVSQ